MKKPNQIRKNRKALAPPAQAAPPRFPNCCAELKVSIVRDEPNPRRVTLESPNQVRDLWRRTISKSAWYHQDKEHLVSICLDARHNLKGYSLVSIGSLNETLAHPREVFRPAIAVAAHGVIVVHNHPSGDLSPSVCDLALTRRLSAAGKLLQIPLEDHVIVCDSPTARRSQTFLSLRGIFPSWPPVASELDDWQEARTPKRLAGSGQKVKIDPAGHVPKTDPLANVDPERKITVKLTRPQWLQMKEANAAGSLKMFLDTASDSQLEPLRQATTVLFQTDFSNKSAPRAWFVAVHDLQPDEALEDWQRVKFQRGLIDAELLRRGARRKSRRQRNTATERESGTFPLLRKHRGPG